MLVGSTRASGLLVGLLLLAVSSAASAQMGNMGITNGVTSAISQLSSGLGKKFGKDKRADLEAEHAKFFGSLDAQTAGLDPEQRQRIVATMESQWTTIENGLLLSNAQAAADKKAPVFSLKQLALDVGGGMVLDSQIGAISGGASDILGSAAMQGVVDGLAGESSGDPVVWSSGIPPGMGGMSISAAVAGATAGAAAGTVKDSVADVVGGVASKPAPIASSIKWSDDISPSVFLGKHPSELLAKDLYRENGFIGWKRIEQRETTQVYAPVTGDKQIRAAVFQTDPASGQVNSAFRVLNGSIVNFGPLVERISAEIKLPARYASSGDALRAVWANGFFLTADSKQLYLGWSQKAGEMANQPVQAASASAGG